MSDRLARALAGWAPRNIAPGLEGAYAGLAPDPDSQYGQILPFARDGNGVRFAMPEMVRNGLKGALDLANSTYSGSLTGDALGSMTMGGMGGGATMAPRGAIGVFGGPLSKTADAAALAAAKAGEGKISAADAWTAHGWAKGADGKWRYEISDQNASMRPIAINREYELANVLAHPELFKAYPELAATKIKFEPALETGTRGDVWGDAIRLHPDLENPSRRNEALSTTLHEVQHIIQGKEGFQNGGNPSPGMGTLLPDNWRDEYQSAGILAQKIRENSPDLKRSLADAPEDVRLLAQEFAATSNYSIDELKRISGNADQEAYWRLAGEVEARNAQKRRTWSDADRRDIPPEYSADVPMGNQITDIFRAIGAPAPVAPSSLNPNPTPEGRRRLAEILADRVY